LILIRGFSNLNKNKLDLHRGFDSAKPGNAEFYHLLVRK